MQSNKPLNVRLGSIDERDLNYVFLADGGSIELFDALSENWEEKNASCLAVIDALLYEVKLQRAMLKEFVKRDGFRINDPNEFHRGVQSLANKIGHKPEDVRAIIEPFLRELFENMLKPLPKKKRRKSPEDQKRQVIDRIDRRNSNG